MQNPQRRRYLASKRASKGMGQSCLPLNPFVVYVHFPNGSKEYAYLCSDPNVVQGSWVIANNVKVQVIRTAAHDNLAVRYVVTDTEARQIERRNALVDALITIEKREQLLARFSALKDPKAKKLVAELKRLQS